MSYQEDIINLLKSNKDRWFTANEIMDILYRDTKDNPKTVKNGVSRSLLSLRKFKMVDVDVVITQVKTSRRVDDVYRWKE